MSLVTRRALVESFKKVIKKKSLKKITIRDITDDCGINRMTFYYHFKDIYDLIEWGLSDAFKNAVGEFNTYETWQTGYLQVYLVALREKDFISRIFPSIELNNIQRFLFRFAHDLILNAIENLPEGKQLSEKDKSFIGEFYQYAMVGTFLNWVSNGMVEDPIIVVKNFCMVAHGTLSRAIEQFLNKETVE